MGTRMWPIVRTRMGMGTRMGMWTRMGTRVYNPGVNLSEINSKINYTSYKHYMWELECITLV